MSIFGSIKDKIAQYIDVHVKLIKLNLMGSAAKLLSFFMFALICMFIVSTAILLLGLGTAEALIAAGLSKVAAYFATFGIYLLLLLVVMALRKNISNFFAGTILKILTSNQDDTDDNPKAR